MRHFGRRQLLTQQTLTQSFRMSPALRKSDMDLLWRRRHRHHQHAPSAPKSICFHP